MTWVSATWAAMGGSTCNSAAFDRLAAEGTLFRTAYAGCTVCAPSRSTLMTGQHGGHTPVRSNPGGVPIVAGETTVAEVLKSAGYATALCGKWGLGDIGSEGVPWKHGFDEFFGTLHQAHAHFQYPRFLYDNGKEYRLAGNENMGRKTYANNIVRTARWTSSGARRTARSSCITHRRCRTSSRTCPEDSLAEYRGKFPLGQPWSQANGQQGTGGCAHRVCRNGDAGGFLRGADHGGIEGAGRGP